MSFKKFSSQISTDIEIITTDETLVQWFFFNEIYNQDFRSAKVCFNRNFYIISDPPYNQDYQYSSYDDNLGHSEYINLLKEAFKDMKAIIIHYPEQSINLLPKATSSDCTESVSWIYNSNTAKQSRLVTWWNCKPDFRKIGQEYKNPNDKRIKKRIAAGKQARLYDWWEINQVKNVAKEKTGNPHPCPLPEELVRRIILTTTKEEEVIVDPFAGSGTILKVAKDLGRQYIGFEIDPVYFQYMKSIGL